MGCLAADPEHGWLAGLLSDGFKGQVWVTIHEPRWLLPTNMTASNWEDFPEPAQRLAGVRVLSCHHQCLAIKPQLTCDCCADPAARAAAHLDHRASRGCCSASKAGTHRHQQSCALVSAAPSLPGVPAYTATHIIVEVQVLSGFPCCADHQWLVSQLAGYLRPQGLYLAGVPSSQPRRCDMNKLAASPSAN